MKERSLIFTLILIVLNLFSAMYGYAQSTNKLAITGVHVIPMNENTVLKNQTVLIENGRIARIVNARNVNIPEDYQVVDAKGKYLMPGLSDMHTHVEHEDDLLPYIAYGVTTILNLGSSPEILRLKEEVKSGNLEGPDIYAAAFVDGVPPGFTSRTPEEAYEMVDLINRMGWDFIKVYNSLSTKSFDAVMDKANEYDIPVIGHTVRDPGLEHMLGKGVVMVAHMEEFMYALFNREARYDLIPKAVEIARKHDIYVAPTLYTYETIAHQMGNKAGFDSLLSQPEMRFVRSELKEKWNREPRYVDQSHRVRSIWKFVPLQQEMIKQFHTAGIPLMTGTDTPFQGMIQGVSIFDDINWMSKAGLNNYEALKTATVHPGNFLGRYATQELRTGTIQEGYKANLLLLNGNPLDDLSYLQDQFGVIVQGKWHATSDIRKEMEQASKSW